MNAKANLSELTKDEILNWAAGLLNMAAGRELDALIAKHIFGWTESERSTAPDVLLPPEGSSGRREGRLYSVPRYSTHISTAWKVIEKLQADDKTDGLSIQIDIHGNIHVAWIGMYGGGAVTKWARGETAPLAICRAALLAVMELADWPRPDDCEDE